MSKLPPTKKHIDPQQRRIDFDQDLLSSIYKQAGIEYEKPKESTFKSDLLGIGKEGVISFLLLPIIYYIFIAIYLLIIRNFSIYDLLNRSLGLGIWLMLGGFSYFIGTVVFNMRRYSSTFGLVQENRDSRIRFTIPFKIGISGAIIFGGFGSMLYDYVMRYVFKLV